MRLKELKIEGFKSFGTRTVLSFPSAITGIVGPNGSGKSNVTEAFRFVLGEQSMKSMRGRRGEDMIFNGGGGTSRGNRARVTVVLDNSDQLLDAAFSDVSVSRSVYRDGMNEYSINGTRVRHRDVVEMLARANIGGSGHHIISQGEADRVLNASDENRREMLEDGLGLKLLQYRRSEAERKLKRARINIGETELLLREITPHMRNLKRQVARYEQAKTVREEVENLYAEYLAQESLYIKKTKKDTEERIEKLTQEIGNIEKDLEKAKGASSMDMHTHAPEKKGDIEKQIQNIRDEKDILTRSLGQMEGERKVFKSLKKTAVQKTIRREAVQSIYREVRERYGKSDKYPHETIVLYALRQLKHLLIGDGKKNGGDSGAEKKLERDIEKVQGQIQTLKKKEKECLQEQDKQRKQREKAISAVHQMEETLFALMSKKNTAQQEKAKSLYEREHLLEDEERMKQDIEEGVSLIGSAISRYRDKSPKFETDREKQKERSRTLEKKKIHLESLEISDGEEVCREYEEVSERVTFLSREKDDLSKSINDCEEGIETIQKEIDRRFADGVRAISKEFEKFFKILFGGGSAGITIEKKNIQKDGEDPEIQIGVGLRVSLPRKKIRALEQLSGGERTLVSVALLFAISQITPPPFLVLDETDAALDEANSKRYGDMIESLAKKSQLVVVTHNRETMHRAGALYGVTMNTLGSSKLLSVQFEDVEDAAQTAK